MKVPLDAESFRLLRTLIGDYCGISFAHEMQFLLERRLQERLRSLSLGSFRDYYRYLRFDQRGQAEIELAAELLTTNETYFFREKIQLEAFTEEVLPLLLPKLEQRRRLRIWSAGCSSGEEAYTLAILALETECVRNFNLQVLGTDISRSHLKAAREGLYREHALRETRPDRIERYFSRQPDGSRRIKDEVRRVVSFGHLNLVDPKMLGAVGEMDVIFCRNVLIYFDLAVRRRVIEAFYQHLTPGGVLLLGHSESLLSLSTEFELLHLDRDLAYRRPELV